jgi:hypothetical protein
MLAAIPCFGLPVPGMRFLAGAPGVACFGSDFSDSFDLSSFENMSTAVTNGLVKLRLMNTSPCSDAMYSHP